MKDNFTKVVILILVGGVIACIAYIGNAELTNREASLVSIVLTLLSIVGSYLISQFFSTQSYQRAIEQVKEQHAENLRTYALNAAEKVDNLSNELNRLSIYLEEELERESD